MIVVSKQFSAQNRLSTWRRAFLVTFTVKRYASLSLEVLVFLTALYRAAGLAKVHIPSGPAGMVLCIEVSKTRQAAAKGIQRFHQEGTVAPRLLEG